MQRSAHRAQVPAHADEVTVDGKPMLRVRAGPFVDRTQAERARLLAKAARADVAGRVVEADDTPPADAPPVGDGGGGEAAGGDESGGDEKTKGS